jgi:DNA-binding LytR/AlgR family response regulator
MSTSHSCIIIEDQPESIELLECHIRRVPALDHKASFDNPVNGLNYLREHETDLIFMDVQMPDMSGLEVLESLQLKPAKSKGKFILTTGSDEYAMSGYEYGVTDYLLKPISFGRFQRTLDRILPLLTDAEEELSGDQDFFFADMEGKKIRINFLDILLIEAAGNYLIIYTFDRRITIYKSLYALLELLPPKLFVRVHKSFILYVPTILSVSRNEVMIQIDGGTRAIPIGTTYREELKKILGIP